MSDFDAGWRLAIAALVGAAMGLEREWSGHTVGPDARFAGLRTFLLLGLCGGVGGMLADQGQVALGVALLTGAALFPVAGYAVAMSRPQSDIGATTEVAALAVVALGAVAGAGHVGLAAGAGSVAVLVVRERARLHGIVRWVNEDELRAMLQFAALALIVLPLLPAGPFLGDLAVRPRLIWTFVLLLSALNLLVYLLRRAIGARAGDLFGGMLGGLTSSTAVTLSFARRSREETNAGRRLAHGVVAACTMLFPRVVVVSAMVSLDVALALAGYFVLPVAVGALFTYSSWQRDSRDGGTEGPAPITPSNPLRLRSALAMAIGFQAALSAVAIVHDRWGSVGLSVTALLLGMTDVDGLTMSFSRSELGLPPTLAARAIAIGILSNTAFKSLIALALGRGGFARVALPGLLSLAAAIGASLLAF